MKKFTGTAHGFVIQAKRLCTELHPADITSAREIADAVAQVSEACGAIRVAMPILIETPLFDWASLNTDVLVHIFRFAGAAARRHLAKMCRRFQRIYYDRFVTHITIPSDVQHTNYPNLAPMEHMEVVLSPQWKNRDSFFDLHRLHLFLKGRCEKVPSNVADGKYFVTDGMILSKQLVLSITLQAQVTLPFHTTYLSIVQRVYGVKHLVLILLNQRVGYTIFPHFIGLEHFTVITAQNHELFPDYFHIFHRNLCDFLHNIVAPLKTISLSPLLMRKFKEEGYILPNITFP